MTVNRRALLGGITGAAALAPFLSLERAIAQSATPASGGAGSSPAHPVQHQPGHAPHENAMTDLFGENVTGSEQVAMLLYPGFTALDLVGPHYFFACMMGASLHLVTPGPHLGPVASDLGLAIAPTATIDDIPAELDVLFVPGGTEGTLRVMQSPRLVDWVADRGSRAKHVTSVCTGSMILAKAGLLDGRRATSHWATLPVLADFGATPVNERVVRDGNVLTGAGVSAGLDFAIALVEQLRGRNYAEALVLQAEYAPEPPIEAGTLATASPEVARMMRLMFEPISERFRALSMM